MQPSQWEHLCPPPAELLAAIESGVTLVERPTATVKKIVWNETPAVVRYGGAVHRSEALAMEFIREQINDFPVPKVLGVWQCDAITYLLMTLIEGQTLEVVWPTLDKPSKVDLSKQLPSLLQRMRSLEIPPSSGEVYIGSLDRLPCTDTLVAGLGPFDGIPALNVALVDLARQFWKGGYISIVRNFLRRTEGYRIVFTHGDLHPSNILVREEDGKWIIAGFVDWECAGWYPEYWEYVTALYGVKWTSDWSEYAQELLERRYDEEFVLDSKMRFALRL